MENERHTLDEAARLEELRRFGYAPGHYVMTCRGCGRTTWNVDKRAIRCEECAVKAAKEHRDAHCGEGI